MELTDEKLNQLKARANAIRISLIEALLEAGSGHTAGPLDMADIFAVLFFHTLVHNPKKPDWPERDRLVLSNGHICPAWYSVMAEAGLIDKDLLGSYAKLGSPLQGHPERTKLPGIESTSGPLGSGLAQACGYAYGARMDQKRFRVYCVASDGEHGEGNHWEAVLFAGKNMVTLVSLGLLWFKITSKAVVVERRVVLAVP